MKRFFAACLTAACFLWVGCDEEPEDIWVWDFATFSVGFFVCDAETDADLLDPASEHNILGQPIAVVYAGTRYEVVPDESSVAAATRFLMPKPLALRLVRSYTYHEEDDGGLTKTYGPYCLDFGEWTPEDGWHGQEFTIEWGDGSSNTVRFDLYIEWKKKNDPAVLAPIWFDGERQDDWCITLRK
ncbi:MAG: hypothetical protein NC209_06770 [Alistipes sp.]|nr:hypothetical protein [Alistipes senegalensis]MCM1250828.1 hypothetical protein [Alistipes sp.]